MIDGLINAGAIPALEMTLRYTAQRQALIAHNIANLSTPDFQPLDVSPRAFQEVLGRAIDRRRAVGGELAWEETTEIRRDGRGEMTLTPRTPTGNILFHDRNNRDLERHMQDLAENASAHRIAADLLKSRYDILRSAMREVA